LERANREVCHDPNGKWYDRRRAYEIAWREFSSLCDSMTPDEKGAGPDRLHWFIGVMIETGEATRLK
jgi:hypothetical protein